MPTASHAPCSSGDPHAAAAKAQHNPIPLPSPAPACASSAAIPSTDAFDQRSAASGLGSAMPAESCHAAAVRDCFIYPGARDRRSGVTASREGSESCMELLGQQLVRKPPAACGKAGKGSKGQSSSATGMVVVVLEEMDALISGDQSILYDLFQLPQVVQSALPLFCHAQAMPQCSRKCDSLQILCSRCC